MPSETVLLINSEDQNKLSLSTTYNMCFTLDTIVDLVQ